MIRGLYSVVAVTVLVASCSKQSEKDPPPPSVAPAPPPQAAPQPAPTAPSIDAGLSDDPKERPESRLPKAGEACPGSGHQCPSCSEIWDSVSELQNRLTYLGIPFKLYDLGESDAGSLSYVAPILIVDQRNDSIFRVVLNKDFTRFFDAMAPVRKKRGLTKEQLRNEFDNLRVALVGHIWCDGPDDYSGSPKRATVSHRVAFAFTGRRIGFRRVDALQGKYGWAWPADEKPLGFSALGAYPREDLLQKEYVEGNGWSGGRGRGWVVIRRSEDDMLELREKVADVIADFIFIPDLSCDLQWPCNVEGVDFPTMVLRDKKTKRALLIQDGLTSDD